MPVLPNAGAACRRAFCFGGTFGVAVGAMPDRRRRLKMSGRLASRLIWS